jgi:hypothetical protein
MKVGVQFGFGNVTPVSCSEASQSLRLSASFLARSGTLAGLTPPRAASSAARAVEHAASGVRCSGPVQRGQDGLVDLLPHEHRAEIAAPFVWVPHRRPKLRRRSSACVGNSPRSKSLSRHTYGVGV